MTLHSYFKRALSSALFLCSALVYPCPAMNLPEAVYYAMEHNRDILAMREQLGIESLADLEAKLRLLTEDPTLRQEMGHNARRMVEERFSIEKMTHNTEALYRELVHA